MQRVAACCIASLTASNFAVTFDDAVDFSTNSLSIMISYVFPTTIICTISPLLSIKPEVSDPAQTSFFSQVKSIILCSSFCCVGGRLSELRTQRYRLFRHTKCGNWHAELLTKWSGAYTQVCTSANPTPFRVSGRSEKINEINLLRDEALELPPGPPFSLFVTSL